MNDELIWYKGKIEEVDLDSGKYLVKFSDGMFEKNMSPLTLFVSFPVGELEYAGNRDFT